MNYDYYTSEEAELEKLKFIILFLILVIIVFYLRNLWNWIQKRRFRAKYKKILKEQEIYIHKLSISEINNSNQAQKLEKLFKERESDLMKLRQKEALLKEEFHKKQKLLEEKETALSYEKSFYKDTVRFKEVQAQATRIGAHFLKNVLYKLQIELNKTNPSSFIIFNRKVLISKSETKFNLPSNILLKIYEILDYSVSTIDVRKVNLNIEILQLKNFLEVVKFLKSNVLININEDINTEKYMIYPTLLFPFIENALKHGTYSKENSFINIHIHLIDDYLVYQVSNSCKNQNDKQVIDGFGLNAMKNILETYYGGFEMKSTLNEQEYIATLKIKL